MLGTVEEPFVPYPITVYDENVNSLPVELCEKNTWDKSSYGGLFAVGPEDENGYVSISDGPGRFGHTVVNVNARDFEGSPLMWDDVVKMREKTLSRITDEDIRYINQGIIDEYYDIKANTADVIEDAGYLDEQAAVVRNKRDMLGFPQDETLLPAYAENEIGTSETADDLESRAEVMRNQAKEEEKESLRDFYGRVAELALMNTTQMDERVAGKSGYGGKNRLGLVSLMTRQELGNEFEEFESNMVSNRIHAIGDKCISPQRSVLGIDVSRQAVSGDKSYVKGIADEKAVSEETAKKPKRHYDDLDDEARIKNEYDTPHGKG